ncbi:hypothetical protein M0804_008750 [Polistes exclamans]|nr:hypothetical protein M0804_008750 [Polistes exclamans]
MKSSTERKKKIHVPAGWESKKRREEEEAGGGGDELLYDTDLAGALCVYKTTHCWGGFGIDAGNGSSSNAPTSNASSGRCGFRRVTALGYGVSRWPSVESAPRGLIGALRIDPIT